MSKNIFLFSVRVERRQLLSVIPIPAFGHALEVNFSNFLFTFFRKTFFQPGEKQLLRPGRKLKHFVQPLLGSHFCKRLQVDFMLGTGFYIHLTIIHLLGAIRRSPPRKQSFTLSLKMRVLVKSDQLQPAGRISELADGGIGKI